jgi:hypothetical protein
MLKVGTRWCEWQVKRDSLAVEVLGELAPRLLKSVVGSGPDLAWSPYMVGGVSSGHGFAVAQQQQLPEGCG